MNNGGVLRHKVAFLHDAACPRHCQKKAFQNCICEHDYKDIIGGNLFEEAKEVDDNNVKDPTRMFVRRMQFLEEEEAKVIERVEEGSYEAVFSLLLEQLPAVKALA